MRAALPDHFWVCWRVPAWGTKAVVPTLTVWCLWFGEAYCQTRETGVPGLCARGPSSRCPAELLLAHPVTVNVAFTGTLLSWPCPVFKGVPCRLLGCGGFAVLGRCAVGVSQPSSNSKLDCSLARRQWSFCWMQKHRGCRSWRPVGSAGWI